MGPIQPQEQKKAAMAVLQEAILIKIRVMEAVQAADQLILELLNRSTQEFLLQQAAAELALLIMAAMQVN